VTKYETTFILDPGMDEARANEQVEKVGQWILDLGGEIIDVQRWGKRRLAYEINRKRDGIYTMIMHNSGNATVRELERRLRLDESVLRVLTVIHAPASLIESRAEAEGVAVAGEATAAEE